MERVKCFKVNTEKKNGAKNVLHIKCSTITFVSFMRLVVNFPHKTINK